MLFLCSAAPPWRRRLPVWGHLPRRVRALTSAREIASAAFRDAVPVMGVGFRAACWFRRVQTLTT